MYTRSSNKHMQKKQKYMLTNHGYYTKISKSGSFYFTWWKVEGWLAKGFSVQSKENHQTKDYNFVNTLIFFWSVGPTHTIFYPLLQFKYILAS